MWKLASKNLAEVVWALDEQNRLPISIGVIAALTGEQSEEVLVAKLSDMGVSISTLGSGEGGLKFVTCVPPKPATFKEFIPQSVALRDQVLELMNWDCLSSPRSTVIATCPSITGCGASDCDKVHYEPEIRESTDLNLGFCSYLNLCKKLDCKYLHFKKKEPEAYEESEPEFSQYITADIRGFDLGMFHSHVRAVVMDPPWDIHMELSYGTMTDDEMRNLNVGTIHDENFGGFVFIWATVRTLEVARECMHLWGYEYVDEIVWVKTNQIGGTVRSGRTGHWFNHNKEHCLIGVKGDVNWSSFGKYRQDCDVIVAPVRETSRKPDELYGIVERLVGGEKYYLELFGRKHNLRDHWITIGNQLGGNRISDELLRGRLGVT